MPRKNEDIESLLKTNETPSAPPQEDLMALIKILQEKIERLEAKDPEVKVEARPTLNPLEPYATHRTEGAVTYEQHGRKYDGGKRLIE